MQCEGFGRGMGYVPNWGGVRCGCLGRCVYACGRCIWPALGPVLIYQVCIMAGQGRYPARLYWCRGWPQSRHPLDHVRYISWSGGGGLSGCSG